MTTLPPEVADLFEAERARPEPGADARARLFERLEASIAGLPDGKGGEPPLAPAASSVGVLAKPLLMLALGTVLGGGVGFVAGRTTARRPEVVVEAPSTAPSAALAPAAPPVTSTAHDPPAPREAEATSAPPRSVQPSPESPAERDHALARERAILEVARSGLALGDARRALADLDRHRRDHPKGQLVEEREALAVQALVRLGRADEARARASRFRGDYPHSLFLPAVEAALHVATP